MSQTVWPKGSPPTESELAVGQVWRANEETISYVVTASDGRTHTVRDNRGGSVISNYPCDGIYQWSLVGGPGVVSQETPGPSKAVKGKLVLIHLPREVI